MAKIKFVRHYQAHREDWFDVIYSSGRTVTYMFNNLPSTVIKFINECGEAVQQYDELFKRNEFIYQK